MTHPHRGSTGSSPLARGLLLRAGPDLLLNRIIPARAGFTFLYFLSIAYPMDHPRSRGVYVTRSAMERGRIGSSPLARGLPSRF